MKDLREEWSRLRQELDTVYFYRHGIRRGAHRFDFLRGSETYKYWWGAKDRQTFRRTFQSAS